MISDPLNRADCVIPQSLIDGGSSGQQADDRCNDAAFAAANPGICGNQPYLILKPSSALIMRLSTVTYTVFEYSGGVESQITDSLEFSSSNPDIFLIGASSGSGTGLAKGNSVITVTRRGLSATATVTVLDSTVGCSQTQVKSVLLIDNSRSSSLSFGALWNTRLDFAKSAAKRWTDKMIMVSGVSKDGFKVSSFSSSIADVTGGYIGDQSTLDADIDGIEQTLDKTDILDPLSATILDLTLEAADEKVIVIISDGEQNTSANYQPVLDAAAAFRAAGGIIVVVGLRTSGAGFDLLERIATGGFFLNATASNASSVLDGLAFIKSAVCVGACVKAGDTFSNSAQLDYSSFQNWEVIKGQVDLIGNGAYDYLPGNGLYVDMVGSHGYTRDNTIRSIDKFALVSGTDYTISFRVAGNNRKDVGTQSVKVYLRDPAAPATNPNVFEHIVSPSWDAGFQNYSFTFNTPITANVKIYFQQLLGDSTLDSPFGNILDKISFSDSSGSILLEDDFDDENPIYIPPACGASAQIAAIDNPPAPFYVFIDYSGGAMDNCGTTVLDDTGIGGRTRHEVSDGAYWSFNTIPTLTTIAFSYTDNSAWTASIQGSNDLVNWTEIASTNLPSLGGTVGTSVSFSAVKYAYFKIAYDKTKATVTPAVSFAGVGQTNCTYRYAISYLTAEGETSLSPLSDISLIDFTLANNKGVRVTMPVPNEPRVAVKRLWRNDNSGSSQMFLLATFEPGVPAYFDIETHTAFAARASSGPPSPTHNSTGKAQGELGYGCYSYTNKLIPLMTGYNQPSGLVTSSGEVYPTTRRAYMAFSQIQFCQFTWDSGVWMSAIPVTDQWLQYQFPSAKIVSAYSMAGTSNADPTPTSWKFQGSNDGANFVTLHTVTNHIWAKSGASAQPDDYYVEKFSITNSTAYLYYRILISDAVGKSFLIALSAGYQVSQFQMYEQVVSDCSGCYADECSQVSAISAQFQDPNPLPDIESGVTPTKYTSTKSYCAKCLDGTVNVDSDDTSVGSRTVTEVPDGTYFNFSTPPTLTTICWTFTATAPFTLSVYGSSDAVTWSKVFLLSTRFPANANGDVGIDGSRANCCSFDPVKFKYFKLVYDKSKATLTKYSFGGIKVSDSVQVCKEAKATSYVSQNDADAKALAAATTAAQSGLQCVQLYTSSQSYTATCPLGNGSPVTKTATKTSFTSQAAADADALAQAKADALAAVDCSGSNNTQQITINDNAAATPYPGVKVVTGLTGHITKVTVSISGFRHTYPNDVSILLVSPNGTKVNLMRSCGGQVLVSGINLVFDDAASNSLNNTTMVGGTYKPTQNGPFAAFPQPCPSGSPNTTLAAFIGEVGNGGWALYVQDIKTQDVGLIAQGWDLVIASA